MKKLPLRLLLRQTPPIGEPGTRFDVLSLSLNFEVWIDVIWDIFFYLKVWSLLICMFLFDSLLSK